MKRVLSFWCQVSAGTPLRTCVFPLSSVTFVVESPSDAVTRWPPLSSFNLEPELISRFVRIAVLRFKLTGAW